MRKRGNTVDTNEEIWIRELKKYNAIGSTLESEKYRSRLIVMTTIIDDAEEGFVEKYSLHKRRNMVVKNEMQLVRHWKYRLQTQRNTIH